MLCLAIYASPGGAQTGVQDLAHIETLAIQRYGDEAGDRVRRWRQLLLSAEPLDERRQIRMVNEFFNRNIVYRSDQELWGSEDHWATPLEALGRAGGDCEDYSIAKYASLRMLGIPDSRLRLFYVHARLGATAEISPWRYDDRLWAKLELQKLKDEYELATRENITALRLHIAAHAKAEGDLDHAVETLDANLEDYPDDPETLRQAGIYLLVSGDIDRAMELWANYLAHASDIETFTDRLAKIATMAIHHGEVDAAALHLRQGLGIDDDSGFPTYERFATYDQALPHLRWPYTRLVQAESRRGNLAEAKTATDGVLTSRLADGDTPLSPEAIYSATARLGKPLEAPSLQIYVLEQAVEELAQPGANISFYLAELYVDEGRPEDARAVLDRLVSASNSGSSEGYRTTLRVARWCVEYGQYQWARDFYMHLWRSVEHEGSPTHFTEGALFPKERGEYIDVLAELGDVDGVVEAIDNYTAVVEQWREVTPVSKVPADWEVMASSARWLHQVGLLDEAVATARRAYEAEPRADTVQLLASFYADEGDLDGARRIWLEGLIQIHKSTLGRFSPALRRSGEFFEEYNAEEQTPILFEELGDAGVEMGWFRAAETGIRGGEVELVSRVLERYLEAAEERVPALAQVVYYYEDAGLDRLSHLEELVELDSGEARWSLEISEEYSARGRDADARRVLREFISGADEPDVAMQSLVDTFGGDRDLRATVDLFGSLVKEDDTRPSLHRFYASALMYGDDYARTLAEEHLMRFLDATDGRSVPDKSGQSWTDLADEWRFRGLWKPAARAWRRAEEHSEFLGYHGTGRFETYLRAGQTKWAEQDFESVIDEWGITDPETRKYAETWVNTGHFDRAEQYYLELLERPSGSWNPVSADAFVQLARIHIQREKPARVADLYHQLRRPDGLGTDIGDAHLKIENVLREAGLHDEVYAHWQRHGDVYYDPTTVTDGLAMYYARRGQLERAEIVLAAYAESADGWIHIGRFWWASGDRHRTLRAFNRAVELEPANGNTRLSRAAFLVMIGEFDEAWTDYRECRRLAYRRIQDGGPRFDTALVEAGRRDLLEDSSFDVSQPDKLAESFRLSAPNGSDVENTMAMLESRDIDVDLIDAATSELEGAFDRQTTRRNLVDALLAMGYGTEALTLADEGAHIQPNVQNTRRAVRAALAAGNSDAAHRWIDVLRELEFHHRQILTAFVWEFVDEADPVVLSEVVDSLLEIEPYRRELCRLHTRLHERMGEEMGEDGEVADSCRRPVH